MDIVKKSPTRRFIKAKYSHGNVILSNEKIASGTVKSTLGANCLIDIEAGNNGLEDGDRVNVIIYRRS